MTTVISTYNRAKLLPFALRSALAQRDVDHEVIVVDNGSTDGTASVLAGFDDTRLRVIRNEVSLGAPGGRNTGLRAARGEWLALLDDDDLWAPDKLRAQLDALESSGRAWGYAGCVYIDGRGRLIGGTPPLTPEEVMEQLPFRYTVPAGMSAMVWRRGALDDDGLLDERLVFMTDWDVSLRLSRGGPPAAVTRPLVAYRQHGANLSRLAATRRDELSVIDEKHSDLRGGRPVDRAAQLRFFGSEALRGGAARHALAYYVRAARGGDRGSVLRAGAVVVPRLLHGWLRRRFLSDRAWLRQAESWLSDGAAA